MELPLGVFVVAITTVMFPNMSQFASQRDEVGLATAFQRGINLILAIVIPAAVGIIALGEEILVILFEWGSFGGKDVRMILPILAVFVLSMPFYALSTFFTRGFHALKNTKIPVGISLVNFLVNVVATLVLMKPFGVIGIAWANFLSVLVQAILLYRFLVKLSSSFRLKGLLTTLFAIYVSSIAMYLVVFGCCGCSRMMLGKGKMYSLVAVLGGVPSGVAIYFLCMNLFGFNEISNKLRSFLSKKLCHGK
jgi:putative peptidoglycan lipid II flippase